MTRLIDEVIVANMGRGDELIAVVGLAFEARIAAGAGVRVVSRGDSDDLAASLSRAFRDGARGVVSFGVAGGLSPDLAPGTCVIASSVVSGTGRFDRFNTHEDWSQALAQDMPGAVRGALYGSAGPVTHPQIKAALHRQTGAVAVDMESHIVGDVAAAHDLPMAAIRVITDPATRELPASVLSAMRPNGAVDIPALIWAMLKRPSDLPTLLQLAVDMHAAHATLLRGRELLAAGPRSAQSAPKVAEGFQIGGRSASPVPVTG